MTAVHSKIQTLQQTHTDTLKVHFDSCYLTTHNTKNDVSPKRVCLIQGIVPPSKNRMCEMHTILYLLLKFLIL